ncbi:hypothetical protein ACHQM5_002687 [Ranunculus cassubicifolius]
MLFQDRFSPKPQIKKSLPQHHPDRISISKNQDFSTWFSENFYKIIAISFLVVSIAGIFFLCNVGNNGALLCLQSRAVEMEKIPFPQINWLSIKNIAEVVVRIGVGWFNFEIESASGGIWKLT